MNATLYGVGVGPGDPDLITVKALKIIKQANIIALPENGKEEITALSIASKATDLSGKELLKLHMPMTKDKAMLEKCHDDAAKQIIERLEKGQDVAFLTLGDPTIYSTYLYLHKRVKEAGYPVKIVEGIPSFCAAAARLDLSLCEGGEMLHIIPASYEEDAYLDLKGTKVLMKSGKSLGKIRDKLKEKNLLHKTVMVECCSMENERVYENLDEIDTDKSYFSILIVKD